ncbi:MAG TPA: Dam family site-specific DNA-(adenine-N6)-methyltransferase, partial [Chthonomonadaceae bacterium]|nr:Dam family site-specific DNA-(adenine-N6)-methyltransferase [Chthonomonadaceae bacterium]
KLVPAIRALVGEKVTGRWIEPFCGSCVVAFNLHPEQALLTDTNRHIIAFYQAIQAGEITPGNVTRYLEEEGAKLSQQGENYYYAVRERFNACHSSLDFLFLNRACFNGVMRFNRKGAFNTPFCRKPQRFSQAYITKIANQVRSVGQLLVQRDWTFAVSGFEQTLAQASVGDAVYADPPYMGRHTDYYNSWTEEDEQTLMRLLKALPCTFVLSTWQENAFRRNPAIQAYWQEEGLHLLSIEHFYHVGSSEDLRHGMTEALITNAAFPGTYVKPEKPRQLALEIAEGKARWL